MIEISKDFKYFCPIRVCTMVVTRDMRHSSKVANSENTYASKIVIKA